MSLQGSDLENQITFFSAVAFATALAEKLLVLADAGDDEKFLVLEMVRDSWDWQASPQPTGRTNVTIREAELFPSAKLSAHGEPLMTAFLERKIGTADFYFFRSAWACLMFSLRFVHEIEQTNNPGMPFTGDTTLAESDPGWLTLDEAVKDATMSVNDPAVIIDWLNATKEYVLANHSVAQYETPVGVPVLREELLKEPMLTMAVEDGIGKPVFRHEVEELCFHFSSYANIALFTHEIERGLASVELASDDREYLTKLIQLLWDWQNSHRVHYKDHMTDDEARAMPSSVFETYVEQIRQKAKNQTSAKAGMFLAAVADGIGWISWTVEGIEQEFNAQKPYVLTDEWDERDNDTFYDSLEGFVRASENPVESFDYQKRVIEKLIQQYPGTQKDRIGTPVTREAFSRTA